MKRLAPDLFDRRFHDLIESAARACARSRPTGPTTTRTIPASR